MAIEFASNRMQHTQDKYKCHLRVILCSLSLGIDLELNTFIVSSNYGMPALVFVLIYSFVQA